MSSYGATDLVDRSSSSLHTCLLLRVCYLGAATSAWTLRICYVNAGFLASMPSLPFFLRCKAWFPWARHVQNRIGGCSWFCIIILTEFLSWCCISDSCLCKVYSTLVSLTIAQACCPFYRAWMLRLSASFPMQLWGLECMMGSRRLIIQ